MSTRRKRAQLLELEPVTLQLTPAVLTEIRRLADAEGVVDSAWVIRAIEARMRRQHGGETRNPIAAARAAAGLSQRALAEMVGVSGPAIAQMERPDANLTLETLHKVADALGLRVEVVLTK